MNRIQRVKEDYKWQIIKLERRNFGKLKEKLTREIERKE